MKQKLKETKKKDLNYSDSKVSEAIWHLFKATMIDSKEEVGKTIEILNSEFGVWWMKGLLKDSLQKTSDAFQMEESGNQ